MTRTPPLSPRVCGVQDADIRTCSTHASGQELEPAWSWMAISFTDVLVQRPKAGTLALTTEVRPAAAERKAASRHSPPELQSQGELERLWLPIEKLAASCWVWPAVTRLRFAAK